MNNQPKPRGGFFTIATWQRTDDLAVKIYQTTKTFPPSERHIVEQIAKEKNYFLNHLFLKFSAYQQVKPFSSVFGATSCAFKLSSSRQRKSRLPMSKTSLTLLSIIQKIDFQTQRRWLKNSKWSPESHIEFDPLWQRASTWC